MKYPVVFLSSLFLSTFGVVAATPPSGLRIVEEPSLPSLRLDNVHIDAKSGKLRGTARVQFGYSAPSSAHVSVEALDRKGHVIYSACDNVLKQLLARHPRLPDSRSRGDSFAVRLPANLTDVSTLRVVASAGHKDECNPEENRIWNWFKRPS